MNTDLLARLSPATLAWMVAALFAIVVSLSGIILSFVLKQFVKKQDEAIQLGAEAVKLAAESNDHLRLAMTNHFPHIEQYTNTTALNTSALIITQSQMVDKLGELNGYLRAQKSQD